ncbi:MAG: response regulator [Elusimicrobiota bacterium]
MKNKNIENIYSITDISKLLGIDIESVQNWIEKEKLNAFQTPRGNLMVREKDIDEFIDKKKLSMQSNKETLKVLITDDDEDTVNTVEKVIKKKYEDAIIFKASNGFRAGTILGKENISLLILDIRMPAMDGFQVLNVLKKRKELGNPKIIVISGYLEDKMAKKARKMGAHAVFEKPFDVSEFWGALEEIIEEH